MELAQASTIEDFSEEADRNYRRLVRRRQFLVIAVSSLVLISYLGWNFVKHLTAACWLEANHYVVLWTIEKENWKQGGSTTVRFSAQQNFINSERPIHDLKFLKDLHHLEELDLSNLVRIRDVHLANLGDLSALRRLNLDRSLHPDWIKEKEPGLTDPTIAQVGRLSRLLELNLGGHRFSDDALKSLASLNQLRSLDLVGSEVTDACLEHLKGLPSLRTLDLRGTRVTAQGVAKFEASRPLVRVIDDAKPSSPTRKASR